MTPFPALCHPAPGVKNGSEHVLNCHVHHQMALLSFSVKLIPLEINFISNVIIYIIILINLLQRKLKIIKKLDHVTI